MQETQTNQHGKQYGAVRRALLIVLAANLTVTVVKIILGLVTGALAVVADGFHSLVDSSSNLIGLAAISLARRPPDDRHPYGYSRYETLGAMAIGGLMLAAAWEIGRAIVSRYLAGGAPQVTALTLGLVMLTFPVNLIVALLERRAGKRLRSEILLADAKHTQTDLYVTGSVLLSLVGVWLGWTGLDYVVAAVVVILIVRAAFEILRDTAGWLTDASMVDAEQVAEIAYRVPRVRYVHRVRSRGTPESAFVDLHVKVDPGMSTSQAHAIASEVERRIAAEIPEVMDALVHIEPAKGERLSNWEQIAQDLRGVADGLGLGLHDLHIHTTESADYTIEVHLEFPAQVTLGEAHELADTFESEVLRRWPRAGQVVTHLEPLPEAVLPPGRAPDPEDEARIRAVLGRHVKGEQLREVQLFYSGGHLHAAITLGLEAALPLTEAHAFTEKIEADLLKQSPELRRVTVHVEPG